MDNMSVTCKQIMAGIAFIAALIMLIGGALINLTTGHCLPFILGVLLGGLVALFLAGHMDHCIDVALDLDPESATKYTRKMSAIRFLVMIAALFAALFFSNFFNPIGVLLGLLALKLSAYAQPLTSKYISK